MLLVLLAAAAVVAAPAAGQTPRQIRVDVQFRQTGTQSRDAAGAAGGLIVSPRGSLRPRGGVGAGSTETRVQQSTGIFTLVQDGGESDPDRGQPGAVCSSFVVSRLRDRRG